MKKKLLDSNDVAERLHCSRPFAADAVMGQTADGGTVLTTPGRAVIAAGASTATLGSNTASGAWTNTGNKNVVFWISYWF